MFNFPFEATCAFTLGDCHVLARALSKHGYPIVLVGTTTAKRDDDAWWVHALNELPDGRFVDIMGLHTADNLFHRWSSALDDAEMLCPNFGVRRILRGRHAKMILNSSQSEQIFNVDAEHYAKLIINHLTPALAV